MIFDVSGAPIPSDARYADAINLAAVELDFPPNLAYAIANRETIRGERNGKWNAATIVSFDQGHGLFQLTSWWPARWDGPKTNAHWAIVRWLQPSLHHYAVHHGFR